MRMLLRYICILALAVCIHSCDKDNFSEPQSFLSGNLLYQGDTINVERNQVPFQLYQYGFGKVGAINGSFTQTGGYSSALFDGDYKLIIPNGQGPFMISQKTAGVPDSISVSLKGSQTVDIQVIPYYIIHSFQAAKAGADSIHATFNIQKIITDLNAKNVEYVSLYVNKTQFVSGLDNIDITTGSLAGSAITDLTNVQLGTTYNAPVPTQNYVFARIGLKIVGVEDLIFSPLVQVQL